MSYGLMRGVYNLSTLAGVSEDLVQTLLMIRMTVFMFLYLLEHIFCEAENCVVSLYIVSL
jgi:hypothetical protein